MPSGHSAWATGLWVVWTWDLVLLRQLRLADGPRTALAFLLAFAFLPIPPMRVVIGDHTESQAMAGSLLGLIAGSIWIFTRWQERLELRLSDRANQLRETVTADRLRRQDEIESQ